MKKLTHTLLAAGVMLSAALVSHAQSEIKVATVDLDKVFSQHYETIAEQAKISGQQQAARDNLNKMQKERSDLYDQAKALDEQRKNPTLTADAKAKVESDESAKMGEIRQKESDMQSYNQSASQAIQKEYVGFRTQLLEEITKVVTTVAKNRGATLVLVSGPGSVQVLYSDPSYDITSDVMAEINKNKPAGAPTAPGATPSPSAGSAPSTSDSTPHFSVPNVTPSSQ